MPGKNIAIDLGTNSIKVYVKGRGIVMCQANAISYDAHTDEIVAIGNSAKAMLERAPDTLELVRPIRSGAIADFSVMHQILSSVIEHICKNEIFKPNVIISAPSSCTALEKKTIIDVCCAAGAGKVSVIDEPVASAIGCAMQIDRPHGTMVIDIGAGTSDIAIITMGTVAYSSSLRLGGDDMDDAICRYIKKEKDILIGMPTAEKIKNTIGCADESEEELEMSANGKDVVTGMPMMFTVTSKEISEALSDCISLIIREVRSVLEQTPPELHADICSDGIILTGGVAKLKGLAQKLQKKFGVNIVVASDSEHTAAKGAGYALKNMKNLEDNGYIFKLKEQDVLFVKSH